jgi:hypothetical protein
LSPIIANSPNLQIIWGNFYEHSAIGMFISCIGATLFVMAGCLARQQFFPKKIDV